ncbi:FK506-binding protein 1 [Diplonema papillatum]|nr:FK506-binding protein 1 [Diplonema papillatum]
MRCSRRLLGLTKTVLKGGCGKEFPRAGDTAVVEWYMSDPLTGQQYFTTTEHVSRVLLGHNYFMRAVEETLPSMSVGEEVEVLCSHEYAFGQHGVPPMIPPQADLKLRLKLLSIDTCFNDSQ